MRIPCHALYFHFFAMSRLWENLKCSICASCKHNLHLTDSNQKCIFRWLMSEYIDQFCKWIMRTDTTTSYAFVFFFFLNCVKMKALPLWRIISHKAERFVSMLVVTPCGIAGPDRFKSFGSGLCLRRASMPVCVCTYKSTWRFNPEDQHWQPWERQVSCKGCNWR